MNRRIEFVLLMVVAVVISYLPVVSWPFMWVQTFFHEISHGVAALITGGGINRIELDLRGSGVCYTQGGVRFIVSIAGYLGAALSGMFFYLSVTGLGQRNVRFFSALFGGLALLTLAFWGRDLTTILILLVISALSFIPLINNWHPKAMHLLMQFVGCYILLDALKSPLYLIDARNFGDGATLAQMTHIPAILWVALWELSALICVWTIWGHIKSPGNEQRGQFRAGFRAGVGPR